MKKHGSWVAEVGWFFRHLFSTIDSTTGESLKGWAYAPMEITRPWLRAFGRGPLGGTSGFRDVAPSRNGSKESRIDSDR